MLLLLLLYVALRFLDECVRLGWLRMLRLSRVPFLPEELDALPFRFTQSSAEDLRVGDLALLLSEYKYQAKLLRRLQKVVCPP
jgi:hypothetical protein